MRKILIVCPTGKFNTGGEFSNHQLVLYLVKKGYDVRIITSWRGEYNKVLTRAGIKNSVGDYNWWTFQDDPNKLSVRCMTALQKITAEITKFNPDVIITNTLVIPWGALAAALTNKPHIWIGREFPLGDFSYLDNKMGFIQKYANTVLANSQELANLLNRTYKFPVSYFYSYVDSSKLRLNDTITQTRLVSPNYINDHKNQIELIQALSILKRRDPSFDTPVLFIGEEKEGAYVEKIKRLIKQNHLEGLVSFHGFVPEPWKMIGPNDILVQTSVAESIGRTTTEAMKLGIPVVASDIPGHREAFRLGGGTLYESKNPEDLANKLHHALTNRPSLKEAAQEIRKKVLKTMSEEVCNKPVLEAIDKVQGKPNPQAELGLIAPYLLSYVANREHAVKTQEETIVGQQRTISKLQEYIEALRSSKSYRLGQAQVHAVRRVIDPFNSRRSKT